MTSGKWHLRSEGYMKPGCDYQEIAHMKANRAIEHGARLVFTKKDGDGNVLDERVYLRPRHGGTQWKKLFGTPERAARVVVALNNCRVTDCADCWARGACRYFGHGDDYKNLLEWLESEECDD